jgi:hypothetical protein
VAVLPPAVLTPGCAGAPVSCIVDSRAGNLRLAIIAGSLAVTAGTAALAFLLGGVGYDVRRFSIHEGRLERLVAKEPTLEQVTEGLAAEGARLVAGDGIDAGPRQAEVAEKARRWGTVRVFETADMLYFLYFDSEGTLREFTLVSR